MMIWRSLSVRTGGPAMLRPQPNTGNPSLVDGKAPIARTGADQPKAAPGLKVVAPRPGDEGPAGTSS